MGAFNQLKKALQEQQKRGCETTDTVKEFVKGYEEQLNTEKQLLKDRQRQEREDR
ncbi:hypothetical protein [Almyronema epifaneia]|uniref:Uncharacterized protein n=1 Tax=Almyronema epifaneia S1 TaxID=2991925 RepID=A0ABW6ICQ3_9CYAN